MAYPYIINPSEFDATIDQIEDFVSQDTDDFNHGGELFDDASDIIIPSLPYLIQNGREVDYALRLALIDVLTQLAEISIVCNYWDENEDMSEISKQGDVIELATALIKKLNRIRNSSNYQPFY